MSFDRRDFLTALVGGMVALTNAEAANLEGCGQGDGPPDPDSLARAGALRGIVVGAAVSSEQFIDTSYRAVLLKDCAALVPEWQMKWTATRKAPKTFDFAGMDLIARFASDHCLGLRGHPLIWHGAMPSWAEQEILAGGAQRHLEAHIRVTVGRYKSQITSWDVVNEAIRPEDGIDGGLRNTPWYRALGADYIANAFHLARRMDPNARLVYNDYNMEYEPQKAQSILALVLSLRDKGVPIDAVGLQSHLWATKRPLRTDALKNFCRTLVRNGVDVLITELDVRETDFNLTAAQRDKNSAAVVKTYLETVFAEVIPKELTLWGLSDRYSWLKKPKFNPENPLGYINRGLPYSEEMARQQMRQVLLDAIQCVPIQYKKKAT